MTQRPSLRPSSHWLRIAVGTALLALVCGCDLGISTPSASAPGLPPPRTGMQVLERMVAAYHQAMSYQDQGELHVRYKRSGEIVDETSEFSLALSGANLLRMHAYQNVVVCDGRHLRAMMKSAPGEVLSLPAPEELSIASVYSDTILTKSLNQIVGSVPLSLYLDVAPMKSLTGNSKSPELEASQPIDGHDCYRVKIKRREGATVLWIDEQTFVLRRVEYPTAGYRQLMEAFHGNVTEMTITAEYHEARLEVPIDDALFRLEIPPGAELVKEFNAVQVGSRIPRFTLRMLDGRKITRESLAGKIAVIKLWRKADLSEFLADLERLDEVRRQYEGRDSVVFFAVSVDSDDVPNDDLRAVFSKAALELPIARVTPQVALRSFGLQIVPTTLIVGPEGTLQLHETGVLLDEVSTLAKALDTLLSGGDLAGDARHAPERSLIYMGYGWWGQKELPELQREFTEAIASRVTVAPRGDPDRFRLKRLWQCSELKVPGQILVVPGDDGNDRLLVLDGLESVVELGAAGQVVGRHKFNLPERDDAVVTFLRSAADDEGRRFYLGSAVGAQQLHLFDSEWKRLLSLPDEGQHPGIADALLTDLDHDGVLELTVGYLLDVGVHCLDLGGEFLWRNRAAESVLRLGVTGARLAGPTNVLATTTDGLVLPIDAQGREGPPFNLADGFVRRFVMADLDDDGQSEWCAIVQKGPRPLAPGPEIAFGVSPNADEPWSYDLPAEVHVHAAFEMIVAGNLLGGDTGQWVIGAADGSIHLLDMDGALIDAFHYGVSPNGLAVARLDGRPTLLISSDEGVEAWRVDGDRGQ
jgi:outer membrane lipoprotein-sorting protein